MHVQSLWLSPVACLELWPSPITCSEPVTIFCYIFKASDHLLLHVWSLWPTSGTYSNSLTIFCCMFEVGYHLLLHVQSLWPPSVACSEFLPIFCCMYRALTIFYWMLLSLTILIPVHSLNILCSPFRDVRGRTWGTLCQESWLPLLYTIGSSETPCQPLSLLPLLLWQWIHLFLEMLYDFHNKQQCLAEKLFGHDLIYNFYFFQEIKPLVSEFTVKSTIISRYAFTAVSCTMVNRAAEAKDVVFQMQIPAAAFVSNFTM